MFSESGRILLVKTSLLDVGHGQCTDVCPGKNGHSHMGKVQIKRKKPGDFFSANIKIMPLNSQDIFVNYVLHNLFSYEEIVADKSLINF